MITGKDTEISELKETIARKDRQVSGLKEVITGKDTEISELEEITARKDEEVAGLKKTITNKDTEISAYQNTIAEKDAEISALKGVVIGKDANISELTQIAASKDGEVTKLGKIITRKEEEVSGLEEAVAGKDKEASELRDAVASKEKEVTQLKEVELAKKSSDKDNEAIRYLVCTLVGVSLNVDATNTMIELHGRSTAMSEALGTVKVEALQQFLIPKMLFEESGAKFDPIVDALTMALEQMEFPPWILGSFKTMLIILQGIAYVGYLAFALQIQPDDALLDAAEKILDHGNFLQPGSTFRPILDAVKRATEGHRIETWITTTTQNNNVLDESNCRLEEQSIAADDATPGNFIILDRRNEEVLYTFSYNEIASVDQEFTPEHTYHFVFHNILVSRRVGRRLLLAGPRSYMNDIVNAWIDKFVEDKLVSV
ncbi:MAG: hypothetical protein Q9168_002557 [Polycauliona sp. 1 TL-2023]